MKVINDIYQAELDDQGHVITLGNFDGVHLGHQALIEETVRVAKAKGLKAGIVTFSPHPVSFFNKSSNLYLLTDIEKKLSIFKKLNIDTTYIINFNEEFSKITADDFIENI